MRARPFGRWILTTAVLILGLLSGALLVQQNSRATNSLAGSDELHAGANDTGVWDFGDPLGGGAEKVTRDEAEAFLKARSTEVPSLPVGAKVTGAWIRRSDGYVVFEIAGGPTVYLQPDKRSGEDFRQDAGRMDEAEGSAWPFALETVRGLDAQAADIHRGALTQDGVQVGPGPAALSWIEGEYLVSLIGGPPASASGLALSEIRAFAEEMR